MGPDVVSEKLPLRKPGLAHMAMVILHTIVGLHMLGVVRPIFKHGTASFTLVDHLPCVDAFVSRQVTTPCERLPADVTHVGPMSTVCSAVYRESTKRNKRLSTVVTAEWPFPRVCSVMISHMAHLVCGVLAPLTLVFPVPADVAVTLLHVLLQMILSKTDIVAVGAVEHTFTCLCSRRQLKGCRLVH